MHSKLPDTPFVEYPADIVDLLAMTMQIFGKRHGYDAKRLEQARHRPFARRLGQILRAGHAVAPRSSHHMLGAWCAGDHH